jgi:ABC-type spermidine/putrescine transport system permease subunit II
VSSSSAILPHPAAHETAASRVLRVVGRALAWIAFGACYVFLYAPLVTIVAFSFNDSTSQSLPFTRFTTRWYTDMFDDSAIFHAVRTSLEVALGTVVLAAIAGTAFALIFDRVRTRTATVIQAALIIPFLLPGMVLGLSLAITFDAFGVSLGMPAVMVGHATFVTPVVMLIVLSRLRRIDPTYLQASMDLGAGRIRTFWHITLPQIRTALLVACLLGFTLSFDEIIVTFFLAGPSPTLPVFVWNQIRFGFTPEINAIFSCIGVASFVIVVVATQILRRDLRRSATGPEAPPLLPTV